MGDRTSARRRRPAEGSGRASSARATVNQLDPARTCLDRHARRAAAPRQPSDRRRERRRREQCQYGVGQRPRPAVRAIADGTERQDGRLPSCRLAPDPASGRRRRLPRRAVGLLATSQALDDDEPCQLVASRRDEPHRPRHARRRARAGCDPLVRGKKPHAHRVDVVDVTAASPPAPRSQIEIHRGVHRSINRDDSTRSVACRPARRFADSDGSVGGISGPQPRAPRASVDEAIPASPISSAAAARIAYHPETGRERSRLDCHRSCGRCVEGRHDRHRGDVERGGPSTIMKSKRSGSRRRARAGTRH